MLFNEITCNLVSSLEGLNIPKSDCYGFDLKTFGVLRYPYNKVVGISIHPSETDQAYYFPLSHLDETANLNKYQVIEFLRGILDYSKVILYDSTKLAPLYFRIGLEFENMIDIKILAIMNSINTFNLNDLVLELGLVKPSQIIDPFDIYRDHHPKKSKEECQIEIKSIHSENNEQVELFNFAEVDILRDKQMLDFACVNPALCTKVYSRLKGTDGIEAQMNAASMLGYSTAKGYGLSSNFLQTYLKELKEEFEVLDEEITDELLAILRLCSHGK